MAKTKIKLVEVARSFSYKLNCGNYQTADFFCSQKAEVPENEAEKTSEELFEFCKDEVMKSVYAYQLEHIPVAETNKPTRQDFAEERAKSPINQAIQDKIDEVQEERKIEEANKELEEATQTLPESEIPVIDIEK
uniref:Uncharacterized protein n=1 Tax=viral metagenome TaxID=1070528 RepID=A0A6M3KYK3_9ZZZZ